MALHVDEMVSDVTAEVEPQAEAARESSEWHEVENLRDAQSQLRRDRRRTEAEGYDD
jgi:hypothetical protein